MGRHPRHVCSRVGGRGRHRALRCHGVAVRTRRRVRAVPDLPQRTLALRTPPRSHRSRLPFHVRRPDARSKDAAVTRHDRRRTHVNPTLHASAFTYWSELPRRAQVSVPACAPPAGADHRSELNAARISVAKSSGSSQAAKWPPLSTSWK